MNAVVADSVIADLERALGADGVASGEAAAEQAYSPWTRLGKPLAIARPRSTQEVAAVLRAASAAGMPVVPWGGRTGLVDGCNAEGAIALSLERMAAIEEIDRTGSTMTVQAGCVLERASEAADAAGLVLPLDLGARGSATVGGVVSTNAGGNRVLRYGMTRDMVLGLEVVLADGTVVSALNHLIKNNTGYDLSSSSSARRARWAWSPARSSGCAPSPPRRTRRSSPWTPSTTCRSCCGPWKPSSAARSRPSR